MERYGKFIAMVINWTWLSPIVSALFTGMMLKLFDVSSRNSDEIGAVLFVVAYIATSIGFTNLLNGKYDK